MVRLSSVGSYWMEEGASCVIVSGTWLSDFGFEKDQKVVIDITDRQIVIKAVDEED